jgi:hypothetical protein
MEIAPCLAQGATVLCGRSQSRTGVDDKQTKANGEVARPAPGREANVPQEAIPTSAKQMTQRLLQVSDQWTPDGEQHYFDFINALRADREQSAALLHEALSAALSPPVQQVVARRIVYAIGHIAHESSMPILDDLIAEQMQLAMEGEDLERREHNMLAGMALHVLEAIVDRYRTPTHIKSFQRLLDSLLSMADISPHLAATASSILISHALDRDAERQRVALLLGNDFADLGELTIRPVRKK